MKNINIKWTLLVTLIAFILSLTLSAILMITLDSISLSIAILITFFFIIIGIIFDIIGVAVTSCDEIPFHSMSARKLKGGKTGIKLIRNTSKVSSICCDVIGDVCGIISGTAGVTIISLITELTSWNQVFISLIVPSLISALTIGGKSLGKGIAVKDSQKIVTLISKILPNI